MNERINKIAKNLQVFRQGVASHDEKCKSPAYGIGLSHFDMERLGFDEGEILWGKVGVYNDGGQSASFRILCEADHAGDTAPTEAISIVVPAISLS